MAFITINTNIGLATIQSEHILMIEPYPGKTFGSSIRFVNGYVIYVQEDLEQIQNLINMSFDTS